MELVVLVIIFTLVLLYKNDEPTDITDLWKNGEPTDIADLWKNDEPTDIADLMKNYKSTNIIDIVKDAYLAERERQEEEERLNEEYCKATKELFLSKEYQKEGREEFLKKIASELEEKRKDTSVSNGSIQRTEPIKTKDLNYDSIRKKEYHLEITLTPDRYLDHSGLTARRKLFNSKALEELKIIHDSSNAYDTKAIKVLYDNINIGFIIKQGTNREVDDFCFMNNSLLKDIKLTWENRRLILTKLD